MRGYMTKEKGTRIIRDRDRLKTKYKKGYSTPQFTVATLRLPNEVVDYFKMDGPGWQTRVIRVLKNYVRHRKMLDEQRTTY